MTTFSPSRFFALELDSKDELASFREAFVITEKRREKYSL
jgi:hypothetical protein